MAIERNWKARLQYRSDEFLSGGAGKQLFFLFMATMTIVVVFTALSFLFKLDGAGSHLLDRAWFYFTRLLDAGTMSGDGEATDGAAANNFMRLVSTIATIMGVIVAGLLISSLSGNFQDRLDTIRRTGSPVMEEDHYLILGWSEKIFSVIDQLSEANVGKGNIIVVVMAEGEKIEMEEALRERLVHLDRIKLIVRSGSSVALLDLSRVSFDHARAIVVLLDEHNEDPNAADGTVIKTLMAIYNHPDLRSSPRAAKLRVTAEVMLPENLEIAHIASGGRAQVVKTNEIISKIILQTSRITGLSLVYDELLRFEGSEIHFARIPQAAGRRFGDLVLDFPAGCLLGVGKLDGSGHTLNPPADRVIGPDEAVLVLAEDENIAFRPYAGAARATDVRGTAAPGQRPVEELLVLGWNEKVFPIVAEFDRYVGAGSTLMMVSEKPVAEREALLAEHCPNLANITVRHHHGSFTSRALLDEIQPQNYPTVMVLGDADSGGAEAADTRAIIALLLLRDCRQRAGVMRQEVCSEILDPKNRELAATTEIRDIVISNEMVSMVLAQVTNDPRVRPVLEDLFAADGSEIYIKDLSLYAPPGQPVSFEYLTLAALARNELVMGLQRYVDDPAQRYGIALNPKNRTETFLPQAGDRLVVLAEDDG